MHLLKLTTAFLLLTMFTACNKTYFDKQGTKQINYHPKDNIIKIYGAGGPHTAIIRVAKIFTKKTNIPVQVYFGPEHKWTINAKKDADIIWGTAEQSMTAFLENYKEFESKNVEPIYIRKAVMVVQKNNPKNIQKFSDLLKPNIKIVVTEGAGVYNTSGTGVWEDIAGRLGSLQDIKSFRKNIVAYAKGSGAGFRAFKEKQADAWITWEHWQINHQDDADIVKFSKNRTIYRDLSIVTNSKADKTAKQFIEFLKGQEAYEVFKSEGWTH